MGQSWSGIRKRLEQDLLCEKLRGRVRYFITKYRKAHDDEARVAVVVDDREVLKGNVFAFYKEANPMTNKLKKEENIPKRKWDGNKIINIEVNEAIEKRVDRMLIDKGNIDTYLFTEALDFYMHHSIDESLESTDALVRMFAILDRRVGKRRLRELAETVDKQPEWLQFFYRLRMESEGIRLD